MEVLFAGRTCEFDSIFVYDNIVAIAEDTYSGSSDATRAHLLKKNLLYEHIAANKDAFITFLSEKFPEFLAAWRAQFSPPDFKVVIVYCSRERLQAQHKDQFPDITFLEQRHLLYFDALVRTIGLSARFELFKFLGLKFTDIGTQSGSNKKVYDGFILPESPSGFPADYKIATFYADPETLITLSYVLRKDSWSEGDGLYQRMIGRFKIRNMRQFLAEDNRVFVNNIIVSLPPETKILDIQSDQKKLRDVTKMESVKIEIPQVFNSVGLIDGQHRVLAYHEGADGLEPQIASKRVKHQLLVTGIIYPRQLAVENQRAFEAQLFLEINDKQTRTRADLRQAIEAISNPFSIIAISRAVMSKLAASGPLCDQIEESQFDRGKLKSSSIVSYGLRHIIKCEGSDTLFTLWSHSEKALFPDAVRAASRGTRKFARPSAGALEDYIAFCSRSINNILIGYKTSLPKGMWVLNRKISRALTTTAINGVIFCLRRLLEQGKTTDMEGYIQGFKRLKIDFTPGKFRYESSHWRELGNKMAKEIFP